MVVMVVVVVVYDPDTRLTAFDNLELLVEQIDNASNLESLSLWPPLLSTLNNTSTPPSLRRHAAWVIGTAVQNNPKAQDHLLRHQGIQSLVLRLQQDEYSVRTKTLYALGSALNHFPRGVKVFGEVRGWDGFRACCEDVEQGTECVRRVAFFVSNFLAEEGAQEDTGAVGEIERVGFLERFVEILGAEKYNAEHDVLEKVRLVPLGEEG